MERGRNHTSSDVFASIVGSVRLPETEGRVDLMLGIILSFAFEHLPSPRTLRKLALSKKALPFETEDQKWKIEVDTTGTPVINFVRTDEDAAKSPKIDLIVDLSMQQVNGIEVWTSETEHVATPFPSPMEIPENQG